MSRRRFAAYFFALAACATGVFASTFFEPNAAADTLQYAEIFSLPTMHGFGQAQKLHLHKKTAAPAQIASAD